MNYREKERKTVAAGAGQLVFRICFLLSSTISQLVLMAFSAVAAVAAVLISKCEIEERRTPVLARSLSIETKDRRSAESLIELPKWDDLVESTEQGESGGKEIE